MIRPLAACVLMAALAAGDAVPPSVPEAYARQAVELAPAGTARPAAVLALHAFVRDRIAEVAATYS